MTPDPRLEAGDAVRVLRGAYRGFVGPVIARDLDGDWLTVVLPVLGRPTAIALDRRSVEPAR